MVTERHYQMVERQTAVAERCSGQFRLNLITALPNRRTRTTQLNPSISATVLHDVDGCCCFLFLRLMRLHANSLYSGKKCTDALSKWRGLHLTAWASVKAASSPTFGLHENISTMPCVNFCTGTMPENLRNQQPSGGPKCARSFSDCI